MNIKKGFTMTEILVAMGILGVLAAILIPAFYRSKPNQEMLMLKKSYYLMSRAISEVINDEYFYPDTDDENTSGFSNTSAVSYHGTTYGNNDSTITGRNTKFCGLIAARMNLQGSANCSEDITAFSEGSHFTTAEGAEWILPINDFNSGQSTSTQTIYVDVNGRNKGKNCFVGDANCSAPDRFEIKVDRWGKITVDDEITRRYLASTNITKTYKQIRDEQ